MVSTQFHAQVKVFQTANEGEYVINTLTCFFRAQGISHQTTTHFTPQKNGVSEMKNRHLLEVARSLILDMSVPHHLWGHAVLSAAYLVDRTPSRVLDFRTSYDMFDDHISPISFSKLPLKVFGCVAYVHVYSHQRREKGSEFESLRLEDLGLDGQNTVYEDVALGKETIARIAEGNRSPRFKGEDIALSDETTSRHFRNDWSTIAKDEENALCDETTGRHSGIDLSLVAKECDNDSCDSCVDEFNVRPASALPLLQSCRENELREVISSESSMPSYQLPPRTTRRKPKVQYLPDIHAKLKYSISHYVSAHRLSKSYNRICVNYLVYVCQLSCMMLFLTPKWVDGMNVEMEALNKNETWDLVPLPKGKKAVGCRWVFTLKHKVDGFIDPYKARMVANGYTQTYGVDYLDTFALVAKLNTVHVLLSMAANHDGPLLQFNVKNAFPDSDLKEEIYMYLPHIIPVTSKEGVVCKLRQSLYRLKKSPKAWFAACMKKFAYVQKSTLYLVWMETTCMAEITTLNEMPDLPTFTWVAYYSQGCAK
ncbi:hypothetical protein L3X38_003874 [Prunus dulcis]|uniref:Integrase catalytic domain-containing protein n=1 Tax=Prunus dulcis TaxID=3755 RepID=A0AAD4ZMV5_PRUDU|nr:hypothetical protein L3X38_003874 [Prunus dulcis]